MLSIITLLVPTTFAKKTANVHKFAKKTSNVQEFAKKTPIVQQVTGGGWIIYGCDEGSKKTFGFNAEELEDGTLRGNVQYVDHGDFRWQGKQLNVHGYDITYLNIVGNKAWISGICRLNGDNTPRIFWVIVTDENEPGKHDWFQMAIGSIGYYAGAELGFDGEAGGGGNIQVHRPEM